MTAALGDTAEAVVGRVAPGTRRFLFHLNLTCTAELPRQREACLGELARRGVETWNGELRDTRRRTIQRRCRELGLGSVAALPAGDPDELLIVKTDLNFGGRCERLLTAAERARLGIPEPSDRILGPLDYRVLPRREVREELWNDPGHVVERYVQNGRGAFFRAYVLGGRLALSEAVSRRRIKKMEVGLPRRNAWLDRGGGAGGAGGMAVPAWVPPRLLAALRAFLDGFPLDFGALDMVADDEGRAYVIDVNPTPYWGSEVYEDLLEFLRAGAGAEEVIAKPSR